MIPPMRNRRELLKASRSLLRWLTPGLGVKRWFILLGFGTTLVGLGIGYVLIDLYRTVPAPRIVYDITLQFLPRLARAAIVGSLGLGVIVIAIVQINRAVLAPFTRPGHAIVDAVAEYRRRGKGPKVVAIGGGTGLPALLRGLKSHTSNITAIVTIADDGGSSGQLRRSLGVLPPGDFRNCIAALADDEALTTQLFQYRFGGSEGLAGHPLGNLFITAMAEVTGSFEKALVESSRVLNIRGRVLPSTLQDVTLVGEVVEPAMFGNGASRVSRVEGESQVTAAPGIIQRVYLQPDDAPAYPEAVKAILDADLVVAGPGSLFTSIIPNLLVRDIAEATRASRALKIYVCNVATQPGETDGYSVLDHIEALERHVGPGLFPAILANTNQSGPLPGYLQWVRLDPPVNGLRRMLAADVSHAKYPWRHDSAKLAGVLMQLLSEYASTGVARLRKGRGPLNHEWHE
ncbi:MAG: YvcK family protein [Chloroflexi bacterium]|nr:YvcK family protein [Chloroflexota bacterium]